MQGFIGSSGDDRENSVPVTSNFKVKTGQLIVQDARRRQAMAMADKVPGGAQERKSALRMRRRSSIQVCISRSSSAYTLLDLIASFCCPQMSDEQEKRLKAKIDFIEYGDFRWYNKLSAIDDRRILRGRQASFFGMLGTLCALAQNEWLMTGGSPFDGVMFALKVCLFSLMRVYLNGIAPSLHSC